MGVLEAGDSKAEEFDVIVIGAGLSGLAGADLLLRGTAKEGCRSSSRSVLVLEARGRPGGRTRSCMVQGIEGAVIDLGGQWVGANHKRMIALSKRYDVGLLEQEYPQTLPLLGDKPEPRCNSDPREDTEQDYDHIPTHGNEFDDHATDSTQGCLDLCECVNYSGASLSPNSDAQLRTFVARIDALAMRIGFKLPWLTEESQELDAESVGSYIERTVQCQQARIEARLYVQT